MKPWTPEQQESVLQYLRRTAGAIPHGTIGEEARSLLRYLDPPTCLPPPAPGEDDPGGWLVAEQRSVRRDALVRQLLAAPGGRLPASRIRIPGITNRTALHKFLSRQVRCGFVVRTESRPRNPGGFTVGLYSLAPQIKR